MIRNSGDDSSYKSCQNIIRGKDINNLNEKMKGGEFSPPMKTVLTIGSKSITKFAIGR
jgi:hypothetical protein